MCRTMLQQRRGFGAQEGVTSIRGLLGFLEGLSCVPRTVKRSCTGPQGTANYMSFHLLAVSKLSQAETEAASDTGLQFWDNLSGIKTKCYPTHAVTSAAQKCHIYSCLMVAQVVKEE